MSNLLDNDKFGCALCCVVCLALGLLVSYFQGACSSKSSSTSRDDKKLVSDMAVYQETNFPDVCDLLRERNLKELQLRLDYDRRIARCFEEHFNNSFSLETSPYSSFPHPAAARFFAIGIRMDLDRVKKQLKDETIHPLHPLNLIDGGAVQISPCDDLSPSD